MTIRQHLRAILATTSRHYTIASSPPFQFTTTDAGKLYEIPKADYDRLNFNKMLPLALTKQFGTIDECVTMIRPPLVEVSSYMKTARTNFSSLRLCLWGRFGTGKTTTLNQAVHMASSEGWVVVHLKSVLSLTRKVQEVDMSTYQPGRINDPMRATEILQLFKQQNTHLWKRLSELMTTKSYEWTKNDKTVEGKPLTDIVEMGLSAPYLASDCVGALFKELRLHASKGEIKLFVGIDDSNSLWGKTLVKKADRTKAKAHELTLVQHYKNFLQNDWSNGTVLLVADQKEVSDARDSLTVPLYTPLELFGDEGFDFIDPFIPIETSIYTKEEANTIFEYYKTKQWLATPGAKDNTGRIQIAELSGYNPFYFERICAFV